MSPRHRLIPLVAVAVLAATGSVAAAAPAHRDGSGAAPTRVDLDPRGDVRGSPRRQADHPVLVERADLRRTTYAVRGTRLLITYHLAAVRSTPERATVQLSSGLGTQRADGRGDELDVTLSQGGRDDWGVSILVDRTPTCGHARTPVRVRPRAGTVSVGIPVRCLPGRTLQGDYDDSYVFPRRGSYGFTDVSHADWHLRLR